MKTTVDITIILMILFAIPLLGQDTSPKKIIYETDMCADVDDVGGLAILHAMANNGEAEILAVCFNEVHLSGVATIDAINTWYGRGDIPVGIYRGELDNPDNSGYLKYVAEFPHDLEDANAPSALDVYRQVLSEQPDSSVTIISVGFLNNINDLLIAEPELVAKKVKELVQMAGVWNDGFNLVRHNLSSASANVIENWPTPMVISQEGYNIYTGEIYQYAPEENPCREAFYRFFGNSYEGRPSWDEMAILYGVRGLYTYFNDVSTGSGNFGNYQWDMIPGFRSYLTNRRSNSEFEKIIEDLMMQMPIGAHFEKSTPVVWVPNSIEFDASNSIVEGNRTIEKYLWDFDDGTDGEGKVISHNYVETGEFNVQLTTVDNLGDSLKSIEMIRASDPIFSPINYFGDAKNYESGQDGLWDTQLDSNDLRLYLSNEQRDLDNILPGFNFVKDSIYTDFTFDITARTNEVLAETSLADYSIIFGYQDEDNYNQLLMKYTTSKLVSVTDKQAIDILRITKKGIPDEKYHQLSMNLSGDLITVTIDDSVFFETQSSRLLKEGRIGLGSARYSMMFDDIEIIRSDSPTSVSQQKSLPDQFKVWQNYPNPFNPSTTIRFALQEPENVKIEIYNMLGQKLETLLNKPMSAGIHKVKFNVQNLFSGVYFYKIEAGRFHDFKKITLLK